MTEQANHCPFLNRTDARCSNHFSLDSLGHAFAYCFGQYQECPEYSELLAERRERRHDASVGRDGAYVPTPIIQVTLHGRAAQVAGRHRGTAELAEIQRAA
jgi:hypothetical protein